MGCASFSKYSTTEICGLISSFVAVSLRTCLTQVYVLVIVKMFVFIFTRKSFHQKFSVLGSEVINTVNFHYLSTSYHSFVACLWRILSLKLTGFGIGLFYVVPICTVLMENFVIFPILATPSWLRSWRIFNCW